MKGHGGSQEYAIDYFKGHRVQKILLKDARGKKVASFRDIRGKELRKSHCLNSAWKKNQKFLQHKRGNSMEKNESPRNLANEVFEVKKKNPTNNLENPFYIIYSLNSPNQKNLFKFPPENIYLHLLNFFTPLIGVIYSLCSLCRKL